MAKEILMNMDDRCTIDDRYKWRLEDMFESDDLWEEEYKRVEVIVKRLAGLKGHIGESSDNLLLSLRLQDKIGSSYERLYTYAHMRLHEDTRKERYQVLSGRIEMMGTRLSAATSFVTPEMIQIPEKTLWEYVKSDDQLGLYTHLLEDLMRQKVHVLSEKEEHILALSGDIAGAPRRAFAMFNDADTRFPSIKDESGADVVVTKANFSRFMKSMDRRVRSDAYHALYGTYMKHRNTLASLLDSSVRKDVFYSKVRGYGSPLHAALAGDNIDVSVYHRLCEMVDENVSLMHRYVDLRSRVLAIDDGIHKYDLSVPLVADVDRVFSYEEAMKTVRRGLEPMGKRYLGIVDEGLSGGWIDVYETKGKRSGGYSWGAYGTHPYILLNYEGMLNDVFTLAHEMGHAAHSYLSMESQPFVYNDYKIFIAEIASTVNEALLTRHLLDECQDPMQRIYLLDHFVQEFRGTVMSQTLFAEFEQGIHEEGAKGETLTAEGLGKLYAGLVERFYGPNMSLDEEVVVEWGMVPHFYSPFYVYQYATGYCAALSLSDMICREGKDGVDEYLRFLEAGNSKYPLDILMDVGVDMGSGRPIVEGMKIFSGILDDLEDAVDAL